MSKHESEHILVRTIVTVLTEHPDLAGVAAQAISAGVAEGVQRVQLQASEARLALALSLSFIGANRMTDASKELLESQIARVIGPKGCCKAESDFLASIAGEQP